MIESVGVPKQQPARKQPARPKTSPTEIPSAATSRVERTYDKPGRYSEVLQISDDNGNVAYDFAVVVVVDRKHPTRQIPSIHPNYYPTIGIGPGSPVTFKVRTFNTTAGKEVWRLNIPITGKAIAMAGDVLYVAGEPMRFDETLAAIMVVEAEATRRRVARERIGLA